MQIKEIANTLNASILTPNLDITSEVSNAFSSDLMSDVLTRDYDKTVLITGLSTLQAIRTAEISDISHIIIGRDKEVAKEMIDLAVESEIVLLKCEYSLFRISELLYRAGIRPVF
jgi:hypothetical protein